VGSRLLRSPIIISPDGHYKAYTVNEAKAVKAPSPAVFGDPDIPCANTSRLYVSGPTEEGFHLALLQEPQLGELGNAIQIVDWSQDSRYLLLMTANWQYESDWGGRAIKVLDAYSGVIAGQPFFTLRKLSGYPCRWDGVALGFSPDGKVVARILPTFNDMNNTPDDDSCVKKPELRKLDFKTEDASPLRGDFQVEHYGKWLERVSKKDSNGH
jgi:hypothetical protein